VSSGRAGGSRRRLLGLPGFRGSHGPRPTLRAATVITVRLAAADCDYGVSELAALSSESELEGPSLVAEVDGRPRAALELVGERSLTDPFFPSAELTSLLKFRRAQLAGSSRAWPGEPAA
jgi:hypothetical protein